MPCLFCHKDLPSQLRRSARYCDTNCRSAAYRQRNRSPKQSSRRRAGNSDGIPAHITDPTYQSPSRRIASRRDAAYSELLRLFTAATDRILAHLQQGTAARTANPSSPWREDLQHQIRSQAPPDAAGYRIVLPPARPMDPPRFSPRRRADRPSWYSLSPFQLPDDLRLRPDRWYPLVWVDAHGERILDRNPSAVPGLYFFVGPAGLPGKPAQPAPERSRETPQPRVPDELERSRAAAPAAPIAGADEILSSAHSEPTPSLPVTSPVDDQASSTPLGTQESSPEPTAEEHETTLNDVAAAPPALLTPPPAPSSATTLENPATPEASHRELRPLSAKELRRLCEFVYDAERMAYCLYEIECSTRADGEPQPRAPITHLTEHERRELRQTLDDPDLSVHLSRLAQQFMRTCRQKLEAALSLAAPFKPLPPAEVQQLRSALAHPAQRSYLEYARRRQEAALQGLPEPPAPDTMLSSSQRRQLRKLVRDERCVYYLMSMDSK